MRDFTPEEEKKYPQVIKNIREVRQLVSYGKAEEQIIQERFPKFWRDYLCESDKETLSFDKLKFWITEMMRYRVILDNIAKAFCGGENISQLSSKEIVYLLETKERMIGLGRKEQCRFDSWLEEGVKLYGAEFSEMLSDWLHQRTERARQDLENS